MPQYTDAMSNIEDPLITETTSLLIGNTSAVAKPQEQQGPTWYWPWRPSYWVAIFVIFLSNLCSGPTVALLVPSIKALFCERGIPTLFPVHNSTDSGNHDPASLAHLIGDLLNNDDSRCNSAEYSAAIANFVGMSATLIALVGTVQT